ncbi:hypothetical protein Tco_0673832 [Tanacetum coccineum]
MDIRDEIKLSKRDMLPDFDENKHRNKLPVLIKSKVAAVVSENSTIVKEIVVKSIEKSIVVKESDVTKSVKAPVATESVKAPVVAADVLQYKRKTELSKDKESDKETEPVVVADVKVMVVAAVESLVVKKSVKASSVVADKPSSVLVDKVDVVKDNINVVADKVVKENGLINIKSPECKIKKPVVGRDKDKPKNIAPDVVKEKFKPNPKQKVISSEILVLRFSKQKENPEFKAKVNVKRKMILSKEDDRKKKLKGKSKKDVSDSELETDVVDYSSDEADRKRKKLKIKAGLKRKRSGSDSSELDTKNIKRLISKLEKKVKKQESDEESVPKKKVKKEESDEESVPKKGKKKEKQCAEEADMKEYLFEFSFFSCTRTQLSFLLLFSRHRKSQADDSTKFDKFLVVRIRPAIRNWSSYLMKQRLELELKDRVVRLLDLHDEWNKAEVQESKGFIGFLETSEKEDLIKKAEEKLSLICAERVMLEDYMRKASLKCPGDGKCVASSMKSNGDDDGDDDNDNDSDGNGDEEDVNEGDKDTNGSNPSFGFSKISLDDFPNDSGPTGIELVIPTEQETIVEVNLAEECELMSTPENYTQWLDKNADLVGEVIDSITAEVIQSKSHEIHSESHVIYSESRVIHSESHVIHFEPHNVFEAHFGKFIVYGVRLNLETLAPGLWLDANVIDCWGTVLNHEESFRAAESKSKHFFPTGCISKSMFDGTLASFDAKWESFSNQVNAQFKGNKGGLALGGIDLIHSESLVIHSESHEIHSDSL